VTETQERQRSRLELAAWRAWREWSDDSRVGICQRCNVSEVKPIRRRGRSHWLCLDCWDQGAR